jgi:uncharacterized protein
MFIPLLLALLLPVQTAPAPSWAAAVLATRQAKDQEFRTGKTSPMAGIQRLDVVAGPEVHLALTPEGLALEEKPGPRTQGSVLLKEGRWVRRSPAGDTPISDGTGFDLGRFHINCLPSPAQLTLQVFDPERPVLKAFRGLLYYPPDPAFAEKATLEILSNPARINLMTSRNLVKTYTHYARIHFQIGGKPQVLHAYRMGRSPVLFIPFNDATNGEETYAAGRFLEIPEPKEKAFTLDFNAAFNPLCNYSDVWNCPIPPQENALKVAIRAGERTYPHH